MFDSPQAKVEFFISQLERCLHGLRARNSDEALDRAEIHTAFLFLIEDADFARRFKQRWGDVYAERNNEPWVDQPTELIPDLVQCFMVTLCEYTGML